ncbi:MAG: DNA alkylation repair protein [Planctomycetes bacterium]|nr:DNA alkylation repair protein [Planctomycetota bacterium]
MDAKQVIESLRAKGKATTAAIYRRHGATGEVLGVSYADMGALVKKLGTNHELALELWKSGVHEARIVALKIADGAALTRTQVEAWIKDSTNHVLGDAISEAAAKTKDAATLARSWMEAKSDAVSSTGWTLMARLATAGQISVTDAAKFLDRVRATIHSAQNRTRHAMNSVMIAIGGSMAQLRAQALVAAKAVGRVDVDHGDTACETPDAHAYIQKMAARAVGKPAKPAPKVATPAAAAKRGKAKPVTKPVATRKRT